MREKQERHMFRMERFPHYWGDIFAGGYAAAGNVAKVFMSSPQQDDDGEYFYGVLPAPSQHGK